MAFINKILILESIPPIKPLTMSSSEGNISIQEYNNCIKEAEQKYLNSSNIELIGSIRLLYYGGFIFTQLIPNGDLINSRPYPFPILLSRQCLGTLKLRANENGIGDNPSPYLVFKNSGKEETIDVGHLFLVLDALLHPTTAIPYSSFGIPNIDMAGWVADLAIAAYWNEIYQKSGKEPLKKASFINDELQKKIDSTTTLTINDFYHWSAPESDLLGDIDGFGLKLAFEQYPSNKLSYLFFRYYLEPNSSFVRNRFYYFCLKNCLNFNYGTKDWDNIQFIREKWLPRVDRAIDLFMLGTWGTVGQLVFDPSNAPPRKSYSSSNIVLQKFLDWLKSNLQNELRQKPKAFQLDSGTLFPNSLCF